MKHIYQWLLLLSLSFLLFPIKSNAEQLSDLANDEGLAIVAIYSKGYAEKIKLSGEGFGNNHNFGPLSNTQEFKIYRLKQGKYTWKEVIQRVGETVKQTSDLTAMELEFSIEPGKLNYIGLFMYESNGSKFSAKILNRTSIILSILKQDFPEYINKYEIVNGIYPNDPYIDFFVENHLKPKSTGE